jgi:integrase
MPTIKLTQAAVEKLKPHAESVTYWDNQCPGFGLRISPRDRRTWIAMYRVNKKPVMETIGTMAVIPKVEKARELARASMTQARDGVNPVEIRRKAEAEEQAKAEAEAFTVRNAVDRYLAEAGRSTSKSGQPWRPKTAKEWRRIFEHDVLPHWGERPLAEIAKSDVLELVNDKAAHRERKRQGRADGAAVQAGKMLVRLRTFFGWAAANDLIDSDPSAGVRIPAREAQRDRALLKDGDGDLKEKDADEIRRFWQGCDKMGWPFGPLFKLLLLTAQRRDEVGGMRRLEIDLDRRIWTIPRERAKSDRTHLVHLSSLAIETLEAVPNTGALVFSSTGATPVSGYSRAKARLDRLMTAQLRRETGEPEAAIEEWILHDLRRTAATGMAKLGIAPHVVDKILNHSLGAIRGVAAIYNRHAYLPERKAALEAWGRYIEGLMRPGESNVVTLRTARDAAMTSRP